MANFVLLLASLSLSGMVSTLANQRPTDMADRQCSALEVELQAALFKVSNTAEKWSNCPTQLWMDIYHKLQPSASKTFIDIGCNKGYTSAEIFERWAPHVKLTLEFILEMTGDCGICQYCERGMSNDAEIQAITRGLHNGAVKPISNNERVAVHCIEPSHSSYLQLLHIRESLPAVHISTEWHIHNVAMTNQSGEVAFTSDCGSELCHIEKSGGGHQVKAYSVDDFVRAEGIHDIGILKIDAEGFDPDVITGAKTTLEQGKADVVTFEYHGLGVWADTSLESVVNSLEAFGYACYLDGRPTLTRLDAQCWHPDYEFKWWSNVVCVKKAFRELHVAFERMSFRAAHFMHHAGIGDTP